MQLEVKELKDKHQELRLEVQKLNAKCQKLEMDFKDKLQSSEDQLFRLEKIKQSDNLIKFYTGFPDFATLMIFYEEILKDDAEEMRIWKGKNSKDILNVGGFINYLY